MALNKIKKESLEKEMKKRQHYDCIELERAKMENRSQFRNLDHFLHAQRRELEAAHKAEKEKQEAEARELEYKKTELLAEELSRIKHEEMKDQRLRQHIRENSNELRQLEAKLKAAYCNKQLMTQLAEKKAIEMERKIREKKAHEVLEAARVKQDEYRHKLKEEELQRKLKYKQELQNQMILKEQGKRFLYEEFLREKKMIDDIIQRIHDEDERIFEEKMCRMKKTKEELLAFKEAQELWKKREREILEEENKRIQEYLQLKAREEHERKREKYYADLEKAKHFEVLARNLYEKQVEHKARDDLIQELKEEELLSKAEERYKQELEKKLRERLEIRGALVQQLTDNEERLKREKEEDALYEAQLMKQAEEMHHLELLSDQKKRLRRIQLRKDIEQMMVERRQRRAEEMQQLIKLDEEHQKEAARRRQIVQEERLKILKEHAKNLIGYIPSGVLREEDLEHLGNEVQEKYKKKSFVTNE